LPHSFGTEWRGYLDPTSISNRGWDQKLDPSFPGEIVPFTLKNTTITYLDSIAIGSNSHFKWSEEDIFDPTSVSNRGWDQKLDPFPSVCSLKSWASKISINHNYSF
jgi:hypothetical protein